MRKQDLRQALDETRHREAELVAISVDEPSDPAGRWHPKDHLIHMAMGRERQAALIETVRTGGSVPPPFEEGHNDEVYAANRDRPASEVIEDADRSWKNLLAAVDASSDEDLERPHPHHPDRKLFDGSEGDHLAAHLMWAHLDAGNEVAAEAAVRWAWDLSSRTSTNPRSNALGAYNVACFYARLGRVEDALPLLREGFEGALDLKDWALSDPDLDPIRDDSRVAELLAGAVRSS
jgi:hypothetical protein